MESCQEAESIDRVADDVDVIENKLRTILLKADCVQGMDEFIEEYPMFLKILAPVVKNAYRMFPEGVDMLLRELTVPAAGAIGQALSQSIIFRVTSDAAVNEWVLGYPALCEMAEENAWFEQMVVVIAQHLMENSRVGANLRLAVGTGISASDLGSDINMIIEFFSTAGLENFGWALLGMVVAGMALGVYVAYLQNRKKSKWELGKECLYVVLGLMPGVASFRVAKGKKQSREELVDSNMELTMTRGIEMFAESSELRDAACLV
jgi:hypothetical protein